MHNRFLGGGPLVLDPGGRYIGLDVHKDVISATILNPWGPSWEQREFKTDEFLAFLEELRPDDKVALEATRGSRYYLKQLQKRVSAVALVNPNKMRFLTNAKNDEKDSLSLAVYLFIGILPTVWIVDDQTHQDREILRHRSDLISEQTRVKNRIRAQLLDHGIQWRGSDLASKDAQVFLFKIRTQLPASTQLILGSRLNQLERLEAEIAKIEDQVHLRADARRADIDLLMTMPGMGVLAALTILAEVGDIKRFRTPGSLVNYAGLVPTEHASGGSSKGWVTKKGNKRLRWAVTEVVQQVALQQGTLRNFCRRLNRKKSEKGVPKAACARKVLEIIWHMLSEREVFHPLPGLTTEQVNPDLVERKARRNQQRLELARVRKEEQQELYRQAVVRQLSLIQALATRGASLPLPPALKAMYGVRLSTPQEQRDFVVT